MAQDKLKLLGRTARRFMKAADRLADAAKELTKHDAGSRSHKAAAARFEKADIAYSTARTELENMLDELV